MQSLCLLLFLSSSLVFTKLYDFGEEPEPESGERYIYEDYSEQHIKLYEYGEEPESGERYIYGDYSEQHIKLYDFGEEPESGEIYEDYSEQHIMTRQQLVNF